MRFTNSTLTNVTCYGCTIPIPIVFNILLCMCFPFEQRPFDNATFISRRATQVLKILTQSITPLHFTDAPLGSVSVQSTVDYAQLL